MAVFYCPPRQRTSRPPPQDPRSKTQAPKSQANKQTNKPSLAPPLPNESLRITELDSLDLTNQHRIHMERRLA